MSKAKCTGGADGGLGVAINLHPRMKKAADRPPSSFGEGPRTAACTETPPVHFAALNAPYGALSKIKSEYVPLPTLNIRVPHTANPLFL